MYDGKKRQKKREKHEFKIKRKRNGMQALRAQKKAHRRSMVAAIAAHIERVTNGNFSRSKWRHRVIIIIIISFTLAFGRLPFVTPIGSNAYLTVCFIQHDIMKMIQMCML